MSKLNLVSIQVPDLVYPAAFFEDVRGRKFDDVRGRKPDDIRGFWARAFDWLIEAQKQRAEAVLRRYYVEF